MRQIYVKPETEILYVLPSPLMTKDSTGEWEGGDANKGNFSAEEEVTDGGSSTSIWED